jgi:hypothetical protein
MTVKAYLYLTIPFVFSDNCTAMAGQIKSFMCACDNCGVPERRDWPIEFEGWPSLGHARRRGAEPEDEFSPVPLLKILRRFV